jgi:arylsulfatase A-like enzyme
MGCSEKENLSKPPNIIWIVCEDQSPDFFPMYGDSTVRLPNLERLASQGVTYVNAYSPAPVCAPARSALITGMYPTTLGTHNMRTHKAWSEENEPSIGIPSYSPIVPDGVRAFTEYLRMEGYYCTNNAKEDYNFARNEAFWDASGKEAHWRNRPDDKPFFSVFNYEITHESQLWKQSDSEFFVDPEELNIPPYFPDDSVVRHDMAVNYSNLVRLDKQVGALLDQLSEDSLMDQTVIFFYGDHGGPFPRHKRSLYETGTKVPLTVRFPDENRKGELDSTFVSFIDFGPTVLSLAGVSPPETMQGKPFLGEFAVDMPLQVFAASDRFDEQYDRKRSVRWGNWKYIRNYFPEKPYDIGVSYRLNIPMMRRWMSLDSLGQLDDSTARWMAKQKPVEELYDLSKDPYELDNLAGNVSAANILEKLRGKLDQWITSTNDLGQSDERTLIDRWLVNGQQPQLNEPDVSSLNNEIVIRNVRKDATILWRKQGAEDWVIYGKPIPASVVGNGEAKAVRIGYMESNTVSF